MAKFTPSLPPQLDDVPSAVGALPTWSDVVGRPYALPIDILGERHGPLFYSDHNGIRKLYACSAELVDELCDETRFAKNLTASLARVRPLAGDGLFTAFHGNRIGRRRTMFCSPVSATPAYATTTRRCSTSARSSSPAGMLA